MSFVFICGLSRQYINANGEEITTVFTYNAKPQAPLIAVSLKVIDRNAAINLARAAIVRFGDGARRRFTARRVSPLGRL
jgi:hypothetical protein